MCELIEGEEGVGGVGRAAAEAAAEGDAFGEVDVIVGGEIGGFGEEVDGTDDRVVGSIKGGAI